MTTILSAKLDLKLFEKQVSVSLFLTVAMIFALCKAQASVIINEFQASNKTTYKVGLTNYPDWIELKNTSASPVDVSGYFLSDNISDPAKWSIPAGTIIPGNGFLMIKADGGEGTGMSAGFKLSTLGEDLILSQPDLMVIESMSFDQQHTDISYGKKSDGTWAYFNNPTPDGENDEASSFFAYLDGPLISHSSGILTGPESVTITAGPDEAIHYTLDGSKPTNSSTLYTGPILISTTTVLKAIAVKDGDFSLVNGASYVFGASHSLPIIFITSANDRAEWVTKQVAKHGNDGRIRLEYIESDGKKVLNQYAKFRKSGGVSSSMPQLNGKVSPAYDKKSFEHNFFPNKTIKKNKGFLIRNSLQDYRFAHMRDALLSRILGEEQISDGFYFEGYQPAIVYVDGVYDGVVHIREDDDSKFWENNFPDDDVAVSMTQDWSLGTSGFNYNNAADRAAQKEMLNIHDALTALYIHHFFRPGEWEVIIRGEIATRSPKRVHFFHDIDYGLGITNTKHIFPFSSAFEGGSLAGFPSNLLDYEPYKEDAAQFSSAFYSFVIDTNRVNNLVNTIRDFYAGEMDGTAAAGINTYNNTAVPFGKPLYANEAEWRLKVDTLKMAINNTSVGAYDWLKTKFGYSNQISVQFETSSSTHGHIRVHGLKLLKDDIAGTMFGDIPMSLKAIPQPGYEFSHWEGDVSGTNASISPTFSVDARVKAVFVPISFEAHKLHINELQSVNNTTLQDEYGEFNDWVEIYNMEGAPVDLAGYYATDDLCDLRKWQIKSGDPSKTTIDTDDWLILWADKDTLQGGNHLNFKLNSSEMFILTYPDGVTIVDSMSFNLNPDESIGSDYDGSNNDVVFVKSDITPGTSNNGTVAVNEISTETIQVYPNPVIMS